MDFDEDSEKSSKSRLIVLGTQTHRLGLGLWQVRGEPGRRVASNAAQGCEESAPFDLWEKGFDHCRIVRRRDNLRLGVLYLERKRDL